MVHHSPTITISAGSMSMVLTSTILAMLSPRIVGWSSVACSPGIQRNGDSRTVTVARHSAGTSSTIASNMEKPRQGGARCRSLTMAADAREERVLLLPDDQGGLYVSE